MYHSTGTVQMYHSTGTVQMYHSTRTVQRMLAEILTSIQFMIALIIFASYLLWIRRTPYPQNFPKNTDVFARVTTTESYSLCNKNHLNHYYTNISNINDELEVYQRRLIEKRASQNNTSTTTLDHNLDFTSDAKN